MTELSIITVNYNNSRGLLETYKSIKSQTWKNFEWIIIDANSSDNSRVLIKAFLKTDDVNITYWCSEPDSGVYNGMNKGIYNASGKYLNFMNSGDTFYNDEVLKNVFLNNHNADIIFGDWELTSPQKSLISSFPYPFEIYHFRDRNICHQAMFIKRQWHLEHLYDERYQILADYKNWVKAAVEGAIFEKTNLIVCSCPIGGKSFVHTETFIKEDKMLRKEMWSEPVSKTVNHLHSLLNDENYTIINKVLQKRGLIFLLTKLYLKILKIFF